MLTKIVKLDINKKLYESIKAKQGDTKSRFILFNLYDGSLQFDLTNRTVRVYCKKKDNKVVFNDLVINDAKKGYCTLELTNQVLAVSGAVELELFIFEGSKRLSTIPFQLDVIASNYNEDAIVSTNEFTALMNGLASLSEYDIYKNNAKQVPGIKEEVSNLSSQLDNLKSENEDNLKFSVVEEGSTVPPIAGGNYVHPATNPASMITGLSQVATTGNYNDLKQTPTKLSEFVNDISLNGEATYSLPIATSKILGGVKIGANLSIDSEGVLSAISSVVSESGQSILYSYDGATLGEKMVNMVKDINKNFKNKPMLIIIPDEIIEVTEDLRAVGWTNKILICYGYLNYKNCNAIEFVQCMHNKIYIHASSSTSIDVPSGNILGLINPTSVASLIKRGYKITDCSYNEFKFNNIIGFTNGIEIYSEYGAKGTFYNNIYFTAIWRCQHPMIFKTGKASDDTSAQSGWITEIYVHGGMFDCDDGILIGQEVAQRPANEPTDNYQGLKFYNIGVEHIRKKQAGRGFYFLQGKNNTIINPRFEGSLAGGNSISGAYILVEESGYACNNRIETSNYPINVDRVKLNYLAKQLANPNYDNHAGSYIEGDLYDNNGFKCGYKAIATSGKMVYEARNLSNYYLEEAKNNTINYTYSNAEFAKVKGNDGVIRTIGYMS